MIIQALLFIVSLLPLSQPATDVSLPNLNIKTTMSDNPYYSRTDTAKLNVDDEEWKKILDEEVFYIARKKGTERAFSGKYWDFEGIGTYYCAVCGNKLFKSDSKFGSSCG